MFYTKNPIQYFDKFSILQKLEIVLLQESAKNNS